MSYAYDYEAVQTDISRYGTVVLDYLPLPLSYATLPDRVIRFTNRAFVQVFGRLGPGCLTVDDWLDQFYPCAKHRDTARRNWQAIWNSNATGVSDIPTSYIDVRRVDGSIGHFEHRGILMHDLSVGLAVFDDISERILLEQNLRRAACEDPLTGLSNRRDLKTRWLCFQEGAARKRLKALVVAIDLDGFKQVNDRMGHDAGDHVLEQAASRLKALIRDGDIACRIGGDEFIMVLPFSGSEAQVGRLCVEMHTSLNRPYFYHGERLSVGATFGTASFPDHGKSLEDLMRHADLVLYRGKSTRKGSLNQTLHFAL